MPSRNVLLPTVEYAMEHCHDPISSNIIPEHSLIIEDEDISLNGSRAGKKKKKKKKKGMQNSFSMMDY